MIAIEYVNHSSSNFDDLQCKTAYGFSFGTWFCCIWVLYIFLASGRIFMKPHRYTFSLIIAQMLNSLIHIIWASLTNDLTDVNKYLSYTYVFFSLFAAFLTRCIPLSIALSLISITKIHRYNHSPFNKIIFKLAENSLFLIFVGFCIPLIAAITCLAAGNIPEKQGMMISVGRSQIIISIVLLSLLIVTVSYCLIIFARTKFQHLSLLSLVASQQKNYYSTSSGQSSETEMGSSRSSLIQRSRTEIDFVKHSKNLTRDYYEWFI